MFAVNIRRNEEEKKRPTRKRLNRDSPTYLRHRELANARKRRFLDNMTEEEKILKRAKDREYYKKKKAENKIKKIADLTECQKRVLRTHWIKASKKYRERNKCK